MENVGEFQGDNAEDGIVLAVALITNCDSKDSRAPVTDKALASGVEDGLTTNNLAAGAVDLGGFTLARYQGRNEEGGGYKLVIESNGTVGTWKFSSFFLFDLSRLHTG